MSFNIIGVSVVNPNWDGSPTTLQQNDSVTLQNAPNGAAILGWQNVSTLNNDGNLTVSSAGPQPFSLDAPVANFPSVLVNNWHGQNVSIINTSLYSNTPIWIEMYGPGIPGANPVTLQVNTILQVPMSGAAQGTGPATWFRIVLTATPGNKSVIALIGVPDNNGYVYGLAWDSNTAPTGYTKVTTNNNMVLGPYPGNSQTVFLANMSSGSAGPVAVLLQSLGGSAAARPI